MLVGPATRAAAEEIFEWGPSQDIPVPSGAKPLSGSYLVGARPRPAAEAGRRRLAARATLVGRDAELAVLTDAVRAAVAGTGGAVVLVGDPGLGKTRLVWRVPEVLHGLGGGGVGAAAAVAGGPRCLVCLVYSVTGPTSSSSAASSGHPWRPGEAVLRPALEFGCARRDRARTATSCPCWRT